MRRRLQVPGPESQRELPSAQKASGAMPPFLAVTECGTVWDLSRPIVTGERIAMEGRYKVAEINSRQGLLYLEGSGARRFRVRLGPQTLAGFTIGMKVQLRNSQSGGLILETGPMKDLQQSAQARQPSPAGDPRRDRRGAARVDFSGRVAVTQKAETIHCRAADISVQGMALRLPKDRSLESPLAVSFRLPSARRLLRLKGKVARVAVEPREKIWGISFEGLPASDGALLQSFVAGGPDVTVAQSKIDRSLAGLYEDALAGLESDQST